MLADLAHRHLTTVYHRARRHPWITGWVCVGLAFLAATNSLETGHSRRADVLTAIGLISVIAILIALVLAPIIRKLAPLAAGGFRRLVHRRQP